MGAVPGALLILFTYIVSFITMDVLSRCTICSYGLTTTMLEIQQWLATGQDSFSPLGI